MMAREAKGWAEAIIARLSALWTPLSEPRCEKCGKTETQIDLYDGCTCDGTILTIGNIYTVSILQLTASPPSQGTGSEIQRHS
jgi:hypothetical protein